MPRVRRCADLPPTGAIRFIGTEPDVRYPPAPDEAAASPEAAARAYLAVCGSLLGVVDQASELAATDSTRVDGVRTVVRFQQRHERHPHHRRRADRAPRWRE